MALSLALSQAGHPPTRVHTKAIVQFGPVPDGFAISRIDLETEGTVPGIDAATFESFASQAKIHCPVSKALAAVEIGLSASWYDGCGSSRITTQPLQPAQKLRLFRSKFRFGENVLLAQVG